MTDKDNQDEFSEEFDESEGGDFGDNSGDDFKLPEFGAEDDFGSGSDDFSSGSDDFSSGSDDFSSGSDDFSSGSDDFSSGSDDTGNEDYVGSIFGSDLGAGSSDAGGDAGITNEPDDSYGYEEEKPQKKGGGAKKFIMIIILLCIVLAGGGAAYLFLVDHQDIVSALSRSSLSQKSDSTQTEALDSAALAAKDSLSTDEDSTLVNKDSISLAQSTEASSVEKDAANTKTETKTQKAVATQAKSTRTPVASSSSSAEVKYNRPSERGFGNIDRKQSNNTSYESNTGSGARLSSPTGRSYIVVASFSEPNRADKYASKLSNQGHQAVIIPPFRSASYHRVAIADYSSFREAFQNRSKYVNEFGPTIWVINYK